MQGTAAKSGKLFSGDELHAVSSHGEPPQTIYDKNAAEVCVCVCLSVCLCLWLRVCKGVCRGVCYVAVAETGAQVCRTAPQLLCQDSDVGRSLGSVRQLCGQRRRVWNLRRWL